MNALELGPELLRVARNAVRAHVSGAGAGPVCGVGEAAGVFVTLRTRDGELRGCIGSLAPNEPDVALETARSAVLAATRDPRFAPVGPAELDSLRFEVSVLGEPESVAGLADLDPARFGVVVRDGGGRRGLLLPDVPGVTCPEQQVAIARGKAGIAPEAAVSLERFEVRKFCE
jgi:AmmeMemoRadiSam system protein A